jgi:hypothetical protein
VAIFKGEGRTNKGEGGEKEVGCGLKRMGEESRSLGEEMTFDFFPSPSRSVFLYIGHLRMDCFFNRGNFFIP